VTLELRDGVLCGLQVAVWPRTQVRLGLAAPHAPTAARLRVPAASGRGALGPGGDAPVGPAEVEVDADLAVEVDGPRRTYHLRIGAPRAVRVIRVARDMLVDVDAAGDLAGLWLVGVPPLILSS
jgi:hypothetical protein